MFRELEERGSIFDLPERKFVTGSRDVDLSVRFHGRTASSPLGPAAGPHTQMAQNIVLAWLGGSRVFELKTVQVDDRLSLPRPCIDMRRVGFNAEWSQELRVEESLEEYVKAAMLIEMLRHRQRIDLAPGFDRAIFDLSVGYDLEGIRSEKVSRFIAGMRGAGEVVDRLRGQIPPDLGDLRDLDFPRRLSDTLTLSTFHGCPPDEIERIVEHLMEAWNLHCVVKFNPMLLGREAIHHLLHEVMGYEDIRVPDSAFARDTTWPQAVEIVERLETRAHSLGLGFGVKFSNTLIVENDTGFLPDSESEVYLSGPPLHVIAIQLVRQFREHFTDRIPISFSAGVDWSNYPEVAALGLVPITVCSDLLKPGGYGRLIHYHTRLEHAMKERGASDLDEYAIRARGSGVATLAATGLARSDRRFADCVQALEQGAPLRPAAGESLYPEWVSQARLLNTRHYAQQVLDDPRYSRSGNDKFPPHVDSHLELFDCLTCDKCIPVCPNDANFTFTTGAARIPVMRLRSNEGAARIDREDELVLTHERQIGTFADFCNECGNCDVFCPEEGGPYQFKPLFFGSEEQWQSWKDRDGFFILRSPACDLVLGRFGGREFRLEVEGGQGRYSGDGFALELDLGAPESTVRGTWTGEVDLTWCFVMDLLRRSILDPAALNWLSPPEPSSG